MNEDMKLNGRNLVIGDIHGMFDRMISALNNAGFNPATDILYSVGDLCDRGREPIRTLDYLMSLPLFYPVVGNHDMWLYGYLCSGFPERIWEDPRNGGIETYVAVKNLNSTKKNRIREWYGSFPLIRTVGNNIILHAGPPCGVRDEIELIDFTTGMTMATAYRKQVAGYYVPVVDDIIWSRNYIRSAIKDSMDPEKKETDYLLAPFDTDKTLICGHTPLKEVFHSDRYHITGIDTGSFVPEGHITVMDLDTGEFFSSDK